MKVRVPREFLFYFALLVWWIALLLLSPLILLYGFILLCCVWFGWHKEHKDVLVVSDDSQCSREQLGLIMPLLESRAKLLNWSEQKSWSGREVAPQLFRFYTFFFGPEPFAIASAFPVVIVLRRFKKPKSISFHGGSPRSDSMLDQLQIELAKTRR